MRRIISIIILVAMSAAWLTAGAGNAHSQAGWADSRGPQSKEHPIRLRGLTIHPGKGEPAIPARLRQIRQETSELWIIQFSGPVQPEWIDDLRASGLKIVAYLPDYAFVVWGKQPSRKALQLPARSRGSIRWNGAFHPFYRLGTGLRAIAEAPGQSGSVAVTVQLVGSGQETASLERISGLADAVIQSPFNLPEPGLVNIRVRVPARALADIAALADVINVEPYLPPTMLDEVQGQIVAGNVAFSGGRLVPTGPGYLEWLAEKGFPTDPSAYPIVDVMDDGLDAGNASAVLHPDFHQFGQASEPDRVIYIKNCTSDTAGNAVGGHGNLNAGIIAGYNGLSGFPYRDAAGYQLGLGISPFGQVAATKVFTDSGDFNLSRCSSSIEYTVWNAYEAGTRITSNSWGSNVNGIYDSDAQAYDYLTRDVSGEPGNQEMLHVFSAGNAGPGVTTIGSPASAKNVLAVGATENVRADGVPDGCFMSTAANAENIASYSSRGPAIDGRAKPDLVAPGTHIQGQASLDPGFDGSGVCGGLSSRYYPTGQTLYTWSTGTSHSAPAVAGAAQLVYNYYQRVLAPGNIPSPAMLKALLIHAPRFLSGLDAGDSLPGMGQGWGGVDLGFVFDGTPRILHDQSVIFTTSGESIVIAGQVVDPAKPIRVSLVWTDAPGSPVADLALVNDLDLEVTAGGQVYHGNVFHGALSVPGGESDAINNVENVALPAGTGSAFSIRVTARNLAGDGVPGNSSITDQDFALVVYNGVELPMPVLTVQETTWTESTGNGNGYIDPGETIDLQVSIKNTGTAPAGEIQAVLESGSPNVFVLSGSTAFPPIQPGETQANPSALRVRLAPTMGCPGTLLFNLSLSYPPYEDSYPLPELQVGRKTQHTFTSPNPPVSIPDNGKPVEVPITVNDDFRLEDIEATVGIVHTYDSDLSIALVSPAGTNIELSSGNGSSGDNYMTTVFDDHAPSSIITGSAPFNGRYRPEQPLLGLLGEQSAGTWKLVVKDLYSLDTGSVQAYSLDLWSSTCEPLPGTFDVQILKGGLVNRGSPGDRITIILEVRSNSSQPMDVDITTSSLWPVNVPSETGTLQPGQTTQVQVKVDIPADAAPGDDDSLKITFTDRDHPTNQVSLDITFQAALFHWLPVISR